jgi:hypothetical protein
MKRGQGIRIKTKKYNQREANTKNITLVATHQVSRVIVHEKGKRGGEGSNTTGGGGSREGDSPPTPIGISKTRPIKPGYPVIRWLIHEKSISCTAATDANEVRKEGEEKGRGETKHDGRTFNRRILYSSHKAVMSLT